MPTLCMAVSFLARDVSDLCLGKPPLRSLSASATVADALAALKSSDHETHVTLWSFCENKNEVRCVGNCAWLMLFATFAERTISRLQYSGPTLPLPSSPRRYGGGGGVAGK
ncbi:hypothetical protein AAZV13_08G193950 [Glycine max]